MESSARSRLATRLVLVVAVLSCVFGWGQSIAAAASSAEARGQVSSAMQAPSAAAPAVHPAVPASLPATPRVADAAHDHADEPVPAGHGSSHEHAVSCMASTATAAFGAVAVSDGVAMLGVPVPMQTQTFEAAPPDEAHRAPSIAALCVLRT